MFDQDIFSYLWKHANMKQMKYKTLQRKTQAQIISQKAMETPSFLSQAVFNTNVSQMILTRCEGTDFLLASLYLSPNWKEYI